MNKFVSTVALVAAATLSTMAFAGGPVVVDGEGDVINDTNVEALPPASSFGLSPVAVVAIPLAIVAVAAIASSDNDSGSH